MAETPAAPALIGVEIDGRTVDVAPGSLVWDACEKAGVFVPVYCAHKKLEPVAVCRMCLVEVEGMPKLQPACATRVAAGMVVRTATDQVRKFRDGNLEFLLLNHPLDCPVCDRGGECDLQDFTQRYGPGRSRTSITEKVHFEKAIPLSDKIYLDQERCILCWRCVRYYEEITGEREIVLQERGVHTVVDTFERRPLESKFQGNLPEICPVGALTHAQYRFRARPWDLRRTASVCSHCSYGCNIFVDAREDQIARYASNDNPEVDDSWLCDRGRYAFPEHNKGDRVVNPEARVGGVRQAVAYKEAIERACGGLLRIRSEFGGSAIGVLGSSRLTNEEAFALQWMAREVIGTPNVDHRLSSLEKITPEDFEVGIANLEECDAIVVLGGAPEVSAPVLTLRLFKAEHKRGRRILRVPVGTGGSKLAQELPPEGSVAIVAHESDAAVARELRRKLSSSKRRARILTIVDEVNSRGCQDLGLLPNWLPGYRPVLDPGLGTLAMLQAAVDGTIRALVLVDPGPDLEREALLADALAAVELAVVVASRPGVSTRGATVVLPGRTLVEKAGTVTNTEGRVQRVRSAVEPKLAFPPDLRIISDLASGLGGDFGVQPLAGPAFTRIAEAVPAYRGTQGGLRAKWGLLG
ncbi:MAG TPA: 2Fe-2S iron-sulfur cluster-binding protein [Candidatus Dormibacteraeota bacterium]|nr:2Fe-2S iron-sulfur cluster-binding protein [Candidatus Dormibacteraeota bacterium]